QRRGRHCSTADPLTSLTGSVLTIGIYTVTKISPFSGLWAIHLFGVYDDCFYLGGESDGTSFTNTGATHLDGPTYDDMQAVAGPDYCVWKDMDPARQRALVLQRELERALLRFTGHWLEDPRVLDDDMDGMHWRRHCVPYVANYLSHPFLRPLVMEKAQQDGHDNPHIAAVDMAIDICRRAFRARRRARFHYHDWLRSLEALDPDEYDNQLALHAEAMIREQEFFDTRVDPRRPVGEEARSDSSYTGCSDTVTVSDYEDSDPDDS
ncbi:unnamed protein product, partial [Prorocentrum cordatum]